MDEILQPIANKYQQILAIPNFTEVYQNENVKMCVIRSIEEIKAAFKGTTLRSAQFVFNIFKDILFEIHKLMELYNNYPVNYTIYLFSYFILFLILIFRKLLKKFSNFFVRLYKMFATLEIRKTF